MKWYCKKFQDLSCLELYQILQIREEVFQIEQQCIYSDIDSKDTEGYHIWIEIENIIVAYARILPLGVSYTHYSSIGRVCTKITYRKQGLGNTLMQLALRNCLDLYPNTSIKISAQSYLIHFYQSYGFQTVGTEYLEDNIPHQAMIYIC